MKQLSLIILSLLCAVGARAEGKTLLITFSDNTKAQYALSTLPSISMADDKLTITTSETTAEFDLYKVKTFTFATASGITQATAQPFRIDGDAIIVDGEGAQVRVFALDGTAVSLSPTSASGQTIVPLGSLKRGVYVVSVNSKTVKITKK